MTLSGAVQIANAKNNGGTYQTGVPWRFVVHTTEVVPSSLSGAVAMANRHPNPPHLWAWPEQDWVGETVPLNRSAFALLHPAGTPHTNKARALQVEVIGHAAETASKPEWYWEWLGLRVLRPIIDAGYPIDLNQVAPTTGNDGYGTNGRVRMTWSEWADFPGVCGHANVPGNSHWDPGAARLDLIAQAAKEHPMTTGPMPSWVEPAAAAGIVKNAVSNWDEPPSKGELAVMLERAARHAAAEAVRAIGKTSGPSAADIAREIIRQLA